MKKKYIVIIALLVILSITGTALAAAQFEEVPAKHWSYAAIAELQRVGIIDGSQGESASRGKTITRYEMANIVEKAMENSGKATVNQKALIDKLAIEFALELNKISTPAVKTEKKTGSIAISGDARVRWVDNGSGNTAFGQRFRLNLNADLNENTSFYGRLVGLNQNEFGTYSNSSGLDRFNVADAAITTKNFYGTSLTVGRFSQQMDVGGYWMNTSGGVDGMKVTAGNKLKVTAGFANFSPYFGFMTGNATASPETTSTGEIKDAFFIQGFYPTSKATTIGAWWFKEKTGDDSKYDVKSINVSSKLSAKYTLISDYGKNSIETKGHEPIYHHTRLTYGAAKYAAPGSWSVAAEYFKFEPGANNSGYTAAMIGSPKDIQAWAVIGSKALEKNVVASVFYVFDAKKVSTKDDIKDYFRLQLDYMF
ncbi:hypothetical protein [Pelosinus propionicus]|uniref:SLH domain-containing protein n=1 Tax=Pelosinus propionicus DSM 13327 TaxID=1123291 RepID=A0A1I4IKY3_9FIRM|nr:hypothetical protein [Pelosinus propionicus]SFL55022.1 hypothetical protein SAMN04490355_1008130 [Pelosinus propionicus DSM 13327]